MHKSEDAQSSHRMSKRGSKWQCLKIISCSTRSINGEIRSLWFYAFTTSNLFAFMISPFLRHLGTVQYRQPCISRLRLRLLRPSGFPCRSYGTGRLRPSRKWLIYSTSAIGLAAAGVIAFETSQPFRHTLHAIERCSRVASSSLI